MLIPKIDFPKKHIIWKNKKDAQAERLPFHLKEFGYCNERKLEIAKNYTHSDILILYSLDGVFRYSKNAAAQYVSKHHVIISACNTTLTFTRSSSTWDFFYIIISGVHAKLYYNLIRTKSDTLAVNPLTPLLSYFVDLVQIDYKLGDISDMKSCLLIHNILYELYIVSYDIMRAKAHTPIQETSVNSAVDYISKNYHKDLNVDNICQQVNLSKFYFCKIFRKHIGLTIHQYLTEYRINKSKELLSYSKLSINAIAAQVGFHTTLTYIRCFKNTMHMTPSEYRRNF